MPGWAGGSVALFLLLTAGCHRTGEGGKAEVVYVVAKQTWLRDRIAPVSSKVAQVENGQKLTVLAHDRRFVNVRTADGKTGWLEDHSIVDQATADQFAALTRNNQDAPVVATGVLRDEVFLHLTPGRDTERYSLLPEGDKLQLLQRASVEKLTPEGAFHQQQQRAAELRTEAAAQRLETLIEKGKGPTPRGKIEIGKPPAPPPPPDSAYVAAPVTVDPNAPPPQYEDWWLVRDSKGRVGWLLGRRLDVDVPDEVVRYAEGKKIVGAYLLAKIPDDQSPFPDHQAPEYVMVLSPFLDGLPYDYSRVRLLVWNARKHRYEGGLRLDNLVGYLPVTVKQEDLDHKGVVVPTFTFRLGAAGAEPSLDPKTGRPRPVPTVMLQYRLDGETVRRVAADGEAFPKLASSASSLQEKLKAERVARHRRH